MKSASDLITNLLHSDKLVLEMQIFKKSHFFGLQSLPNNFDLLKWGALRESLRAVFSKQYRYGLNNYTHYINRELRQILVWKNFNRVSRLIRICISCQIWNLGLKPQPKTWIFFYFLIKHIFEDFRGTETISRHLPEFWKLFEKSKKNAIVVIFWLKNCI